MAPIVEMTLKMCVAFRFVYVGILSGCNILLKRMDLRHYSYPPRTPSAACAALFLGKAMRFIAPRFKSPGLKFKNKMASLPKAQKQDDDRKQEGARFLTRVNMYFVRWSMLFKRIAH